MEGIVKWFNRTKGYGFITADDGEEYFVHHTGLNPGTFLRDGDRVSFEGSESERGKQALSVALLQKASEMGAAEQPAAEQPAEEQPAEEPAAEEPAAEEPAAEEPAAEEPAAEEPAEEEKPAEEGQ